MDNPFKKKEDPKRKITGNEVRVRIYRITNNTYIEIGFFIANLKKDSSDNLILENVENNFKEELNFEKETAISDLLLKLKKRFSSKTEQIKEIDEAIARQDDLIKSIKDGKVENGTTPIDGKTEKKYDKVNIITEKAKRNTLLASKYALEHEGDGGFEIIDNDGSKTYTYLLQDGLYYPMFYSAPRIQGEPVTAHPEVYQKKKLYKEAIEIFAQDFAESKNDPFKGWFMLAMRILLVIILIGNIFWAVNNKNWSMSLSERELNSASGICIKTQAECARAVGIQIEANSKLINYALKNLNVSNSTVQKK